MLKKKAIINRFHILVVLLFTLLSFSIHALEPKVIFSNNLEIWTESFGDKKNPALLLIMGSGGQGILWPQQFCEELANKGYYVIRYDNRDTGLSASVDFKQSPYTLLDLAKDATAILDNYDIQKANIVGASMGGEVAMIMAAHYPDRLSSLTLFMTTSDMRPAFDTFQGKPTESLLSKPKPIIFEAVKKMTNPPNTLKEKVDVFIENTKINAGTQVPLDTELLRQIGLQSFVRMRNPEGLNNHFAATTASYTLHQEALSKIKAPTLILHGDQDPIFGLDHAEALNKAIANSKLIIIPGLGHGITNTLFYKPIIEGITQIAK